MNEPQQAISQMAQQILNDSVLLHQLCDRIYDLLISEIQLQQERYTYRSRRF